MVSLASFALGGAQFGLDYGISNSRGRLPVPEVERILARAGAAGVTMVDTAPAYGDSEEVLGKILGDDPGWQVVTKTADLAGAATGEAAGRLTRGLDRSLERLRRTSVDTLLFHRAADLGRDDAGELIDAAAQAKRVGLTRRIGVSVYDAADLDALADLQSWDVVQVPLSIVDQRLIRSGHLTQLAKTGTEVHVRSVFLQGLLLCPSSARPPFTIPYEAALDRVHELARDLRVTPLELCLAFVRCLPGASVCLIGLSSPTDLDQALSATVPDLPDLSDLAVEDTTLIDPRRWPRR